MHGTFHHLVDTEGVNIFLCQDCKQCDDFLAIHFILLHERSLSDKEDVLMFCQKLLVCQTE